MKRFGMCLLAMMLIYPVLTAESAEVELIIQQKNGMKTSINFSEIKSIKFMSANTGIDEIQKIDQMVKGFRIYPNFPNPFNPVTTISYSIPEASSVDIVIFNAMGQQIRKMHYEDQRAGEHAYVWDARDDFGGHVVSGTYFYQVRYGRQVVSRKMLLIK